MNGLKRFFRADVRCRKKKNAYVLFNAYVVLSVEAESIILLGERLEGCRCVPKPLRWNQYLTNTIRFLLVYETLLILPYIYAKSPHFIDVFVTLLFA